MLSSALFRPPDDVSGLIFYCWTIVPSRLVSRRWPSGSLWKVCQWLGPRSRTKNGRADISPTHPSSNVSSLNVVKCCTCYGKVCLSVTSVTLVSEDRNMPVGNIGSCEMINMSFRSNPRWRTAPKVGNAQCALTPHLRSQSHLIDSPRFKKEQRIRNLKHSWDAPLGPCSSDLE